ncbi:MAG: 8-amino-7-oxononanoate synthase [Magnetococcales bacterium]|nr:8-amino-7-oxononanoate synthase [Magnetococcales bacterium]
MAPEEGGVVRVEGQRLINVSSNDYLGLSHHPALISRAQEWTALWGAGATASRLVCGDLEPFSLLEKKLARSKGTEAALIFNAGFQANGTVLASLLDRRILGREPLVFSDRLNHASMHFGCQSAGVRQKRFRHRDGEHLARLLEQTEGGEARRFILSETVFSMDGDRADVGALVDLARRHEAFLYLDEAHAAGVLGENGFGLSPPHATEVGLSLGTFGKGLGSFGAYVACSQEIRDYLINHCGGFIYSTALPPAVLGAMDAALDLMPTQEMAAARKRVLGHAERLRQALQAEGLSTGDSTTPIVPVMVGESGEASKMAALLRQRGVLAVAIRPPTVPPGTARLRLSLSAAHSEADIDRVIEAVILTAREVEIAGVSSGSSDPRQGKVL